ncbi:ADP-ribosylglycohydrolase family protein [Streptomonospora salina]|uniref:ADP-ribosylglycohydrolase n=1 Tax=Streptomonospora salina TaxID=104205 RepID=A0A841E8B5_9ACTN|nr:ADP-ribosylglycohydrolase family protein [Streptomonospora salina]MBB5998724.1 ADP-ribosylglycohydrolase [Streptomonospora salina]
MHIDLTRDPRIRDRAAGVLTGTACGDALGVPYEFQPRLSDDRTPTMAGGGLGPYAPGEYSDDTQMAVCLAEAALLYGADVDSPQGRDHTAEAWLHWRREGATDIGIQTSSVLHAAQQHAGAPFVSDRMTAAAWKRYTSGVPSAGNGSLMRTAPLALAYLTDREGLAAAADRFSRLTHSDPEAAEACILWCEAIRHAVVHGEFDGLRDAVTLLPDHRRQVWRDRFDEAASHPPASFCSNGWVVHALQAAWSAIIRTLIPAHRPAEGSFRADHFRHALEAAVRAGHDTDTVAAIAGGLLGARWGVSAIPLEWQRIVHGWPGYTVRDLAAQGIGIAFGTDSTGWPAAHHQPRPEDAAIPVHTAHPRDPGLILGNLALADAKPEVDAVVSLCRTGVEDFTGLPGGDHMQVWLVDTPGANAHTPYVLDQAARAVAELRAEGKRVLLHCAAGRSRTPAVAARYGVLRSGIGPGTALTEVCAALHGDDSMINPELVDAVFTLSGTPTPRRSRPPHEQLPLRPSADG